MCRRSSIGSPKDVHEGKYFTHLVSYYRDFIPHFTHIAEPLTALTRKDVEWRWTSKEQDAFEQLRTALTSEPVLTSPSFNRTFVLSTDASGWWERTMANSFQSRSILELGGMNMLGLSCLHIDARCIDQASPTNLLFGKELRTPLDAELDLYLDRYRMTRLREPFRLPTR